MRFAWHGRDGYLLAKTPHNTRNTHALSTKLGTLWQGPGHLRKPRNYYNPKIIHTYDGVLQFPSRLLLTFPSLPSRCMDVPPTQLTKTVKRRKRKKRDLDLPCPAPACSGHPMCLAPFYLAAPFFPFSPVFFFFPFARPFPRVLFLEGIFVDAREGRQWRV